MSFWGAAWLIGRYLLPRIMLAVARTKSRELFTLMVFAICSGIAMLASLLGLSIALGAFTAGLFVSSSYYSHRVLSEVLPFKDLFLTIFFVSAGLLIDIDDADVTVIARAKFVRKWLPTITRRASPTSSMMK